jgi:hypothetical protein
MSDPKRTSHYSRGPRAKLPACWRRRHESRKQGKGGSAYAAGILEVEWLDGRRRNAPTWRVRIGPSFGAWVVEDVQ